MKSFGFILVTAFAAFSSAAAIDERTCSPGKIIFAGFK